MLGGSVVTSAGAWAGARNRLAGMVLAVQRVRITRLAENLLMEIDIMTMTVLDGTVVRNTGPFRDSLSNGPFVLSRSKVTR